MTTAQKVAILAVVVLLVLALAALGTSADALGQPTAILGKA